MKVEELGKRIVLVLIRAGYYPDELGYLLAKYDPEALKELDSLVRRAWRERRAEVNA